MTAALSDVPLVSFTIPIRTVSEANAHEHWRVRQKRAKTQRALAGLHACSGRAAILRARRLLIHDGLIVNLTRIAPRALDSDNNVGAAKHIRDGVADALGIDDRDARVTWEYGQERGGKGVYGVRVEIRKRV